MDAQFIVSIVASVTASTVVGVTASWLTFRLQFERFSAMDAEREKHWNEWRRQITLDVELLKNTRAALDYGFRVQQCESFIAELRLWKHEAVDPHIGDIKNLDARLTRLEKTR